MTVRGASAHDHRRRAPRTPASHASPWPNVAYSPTTACRTTWPNDDDYTVPSIPYPTRPAPSANPAPDPSAKPPSKRGRCRMCDVDARGKLGEQVLCENDNDDLITGRLCNACYDHYVVRGEPY